MKKLTPSSVRRGFTLLELLVVVGILAVIAGAIVTAYSGFQQKAANSATAKSLATLNSTIRIFTQTEKRLPDNVETLMAANPEGTLAYNTNTFTTNVTTIAEARPTLLLSPTLRERFEVRDLTLAQVDSLRRAGINQLRFIDIAGDATDSENELEILDINQQPGRVVGSIDELQFPGVGFDTPLADDSIKSSGRGFILNLGPVGAPIPTGLKAMVWGKQGTGAGGSVIAPNFLNTFVNAEPEDVLIGFGIGSSSTLVSDSADRTAKSEKTNMQKAPFDASVKPREYNHLIMLIKVNTPTAQYVGAVDASGFPQGQKNVATGIQ